MLIPSGAAIVIAVVSLASFGVNGFATLSVTLLTEPSPSSVVANVRNCNYAPSPFVATILGCR